MTLLVAGNWKMYKTGLEAAAFCAAFRPPQGLETVLCPAFTALADVVASGQTAFAQNVHWEDEAAYTGEVSAAMLKALGVAGAIVGHSERRQYFGETDEGVGKRTRHALAAGLRVIACVGELEAERERGETNDVLRRQISVLEEHERLVIAYEPVWAIGTGKTATPEIAQEAHAFIKSLIDAPVLYGGSVKPDNAEALLRLPDVDGALVGGASLEVDSFTAICEAAATIGS